MTVDRVDAIRERADAATEGPWFVEVIRDTDGTESWVVPSVIRWRGFTNGLSCDEDRATATFIAHAREDVPYLLDRLAQVEAERDGLREGFADLIEAVAMAFDVKGPVSVLDDALTDAKKAYNASRPPLVQEPEEGT